MLERRGEALSSALRSVPSDRFGPPSSHVSRANEGLRDARHHVSPWATASFVFQADQKPGRSRGASPPLLRVCRSNACPPADVRVCGSAFELPRSHDLLIKVSACLARAEQRDLGVEGVVRGSGLERERPSGDAAVHLAQRDDVLGDESAALQDLPGHDLAGDQRYITLGFKVGETVHLPKGCEFCNQTGFRGRKGVFEVIEVSSALRSAIGPKTDATDLEKVAIGEGMTTMAEDGVAKCRAGITTVDEVFRVTASL